MCVTVGGASLNLSGTDELTSCNPAAGEGARRFSPPL